MGVEMANGALLKLNKVSKHFGGLAAVQDLDIEVKPREIISVIGPNGAGKTTVFNLITGIYRPSSGDILLAGQTLNGDRKSTRLNSSHVAISYAVFCLK